ncbi:MAG TPA: ADP-ribosylglycohydrolase family protein [Chryseosolibacter sp.]
MKYLVISLILTIWSTPVDKGRDKVVLSKSLLYDKIKGGWVGQVIGVTYASDMQASASMENARTENVHWSEGYQLATFTANPDVYDDIYIDLNFLEAIQEYGTGVTPKKLSEVYLNSTYVMSHGSQSARYNLSKGKSPLRSGYWLDNPHADDNDFQIHADFIGMMNPGLPASAALVSHKVGHLMSFGDGYYGGLYVSTLYSLAFVSSDIKSIVMRSLSAIPEKSSFFQCVNYAIEQHRQFPYAWDRALGQFQRKWSKDFGCPDRLIGKEDADAKMNAAYITLALLYGEGDFEKTLQIVRSIRNADANASTVAGLLGVMTGYTKIPEAWKQGIDEIETQPFHHSTLSLADACDITFREALNAVENAKGNVTKTDVVIAAQEVPVAKLEKSFEGHYPKEIRNLSDSAFTDRVDFEFEGIGFVLRGALPEEDSDDVIMAELYLNNKYIEVVEIPLQKINKRPELAWKFQLPHDKYVLSLRPLTRNSKHAVRLTELVVYDVTPN